MLKTINQTVGFRLLTKSVSTGLINLTKMVPLLGGFIRGTFDAVTTNAIGNQARDLFYNQNQNALNNNNENKNTQTTIKQ